MKIAAHELVARKTMLSDANTDDDTRDKSPHFEAALTKLREAQATAHSNTHSEADSDLNSAGRGGMQGDRRQRSPLEHTHEHAHEQGLSEDQVLCATANNPVLAALAAARGPWQTAYGSGGSSAAMPDASNVRQTAVMLTAVEAVAEVIQPATATHTTAEASAAYAAFERLGGAEAEPSAAAETAWIAAQNAVSTATTPTAPATPTAPQTSANGPNVPSLPPETTQRLVAGTVAALRIDRDTANPQHSASILEVRHPELGVVRVEVQLRGDAMEIRFHATHAAALLLRASESELRKAVGQHGLRLRNLQIGTHPTLMQERSRHARRHLLELEA